MSTEHDTRTRKRKLPAGLRWRGDIIHIKKRHRGVDITGSTHTGDVDAAVEVLAAKMREIHDAKTFGTRRRRTFAEAVCEYLERIERERRHNPGRYKSLPSMKRHLTLALLYISDCWLGEIHDAHPSILRLIDDRKQAGLKNKTINDTLDMINRVLARAAKWRDECGLTWLSHAPTLPLLDRNADAAKPYPMTWGEVELLKKMFDERSIIPDLIDFLVNTGVRESEACGLRWEWERYVPELKCTVFLIPETHTKNKVPRVVVLNDTARSIVETNRGQDRDWVFVQRAGKYKGRPMSRVRKNGWVVAWKKAGLPQGSDTKKGVHNLKHTFGRRLAAVGCPWHERKILLGHRVGDVTELYAPAQIEQLLKWTQTVDRERRELTMVRPVRLAVG